MKTVKNIMERWLPANGYDGLCRSDIECGCGLPDIMSCSEEFDCRECVPAHKTTAPKGVDAYQWMKPGRRRGWRGK